MHLPNGFKYVPPSTRQAIAQLGMGTDMETPCCAGQLPVEPLPGEAEWHLDMLRWHIKYVVAKARLFPRPRLMSVYRQAVRELQSEGRLSEAEALAVVTAAQGELSKVGHSSVSQDEWAAISDQLADEWRRLGGRLAEFILKADMNQSEAQLLPN